MSEEKKEDEKEIRFFDLSYMEKSMIKEIELSNGGSEENPGPVSKLKIKALLPKDSTAIMRIVATMRGGQPAYVYEEAEMYLFHRMATIDVAVKESPPWWKSAIECPSDSFLDELYMKIKEHSEDFQEKLKKNKL